jgi:hypothetical protein
MFSSQLQKSTKLQYWKTHRLLIQNLKACRITIIWQTSNLSNKILLIIDRVNAVQEPFEAEFGNKSGNEG